MTELAPIADELELMEHLDIELSRVVTEARARTTLDPIAFSGTVTGFLLRTAFALAHKHGAPRHVIEDQVRPMIADAYGPRESMSRAQRRAAAADARRRRSS